MKIFFRGKEVPNGEHVEIDGVTHPYENFQHWTPRELKRAGITIELLTPQEEARQEAAPDVARPGPVAFLNDMGLVPEQIERITPLAHVARPRISTTEAFGGFVWREFTFDKAGAQHQGHRHNRDHITVLGAGSVRVDIDGEPSRVFSAPAFIPVAAEKWHRFTSLVDDTRYACVFAVPDGMDAHDASNEISPTKDEVLRRLGCEGCATCDQENTN